MRFDITYNIEVQPITYFARHMKMITERKLWEIVVTGREIFKNTRVTYDVIIPEKLNIPVTHSRKLWMENIRMTGSWSQDTGLLSDEITKIEKGIK